MTRRIFLPIALCALLLLTPSPLRIWELADSTLVPASLTGNLRPIAPRLGADFDGDSTSETLTLANGRAELSTGGQLRWQSPPTWQVRQAEIADLNRDSLPEVVLLVWRPFQPWPVDKVLPHGGRIETFHDANGQSCHLILIGWYKDQFRERWAGSALAEPAHSFIAANLAGDGRQFLVALESEYNDPYSAPARRLKVWEWNGFGFTVVFTVEGPFEQILLVQSANGQQLILTH